MANYIAGIWFSSLTGNLESRRQAVEVLARAGRDDVEIRLGGVRGTPFQLTSLNWLANHAQAVAAEEDFASLLDGNAYEVIQQGVSYGFFYVQDVKRIRSEPCLNVVGGPVGGENWMLRCSWTLIHAFEN